MRKYALCLLMFISSAFSLFFALNIQAAEQTILVSQTPVMVDLNFTGELGLRFYSDVDGYITAVKFWKSAGETGVHTGKIWDANRNILTTVQFVNETTSGWQRQNLATPLYIPANTEYLVAVNSVAKFVDSYDVFTSEVVNGNLHAFGTTNGRYGSVNTYPASSYRGSNYFRDIVFTPEEVPPVISNLQTFNVFSSSATISWRTDEGATTRVEYGTSSGSYGYSQENNNLVIVHNINLQNLTNNTTYFYRVISKDDSNNISTSEEHSFATGTIGQNQTLFTTQIPVADMSYNGELGFKFYSDVEGYITAVRFWKSVRETGIHTGKIWDANRNVLATVQFSNETASGWQVQNLATPLAVLANTQYMITVNTGNEFYSGSTSGLASGIVNGNLHSVVGVNGVYGSLNNYPTGTYQNSNYFRDIVFSPGKPGADINPPTVSIVSPLNNSTVNGAINVDVNATDDTAVNYVELRMDSILLGTDSTLPYRFSVDTTAYSNGQHVLGARAYDTAGNLANSTNVNINIYNPIADTTAPLISNIQVFDISSSSATISWITDEPATSRVEYGSGLHQENLALVESHRVILQNLNPETLYNFIVNSIDESGNSAVSGENTFITSSIPILTSINQGHGGPVLVIASNSNPFTFYYAEILRAEGLNEFQVADISSVTSGTLNGFEVVILGELPLTTAQVSMFENWVNSGGNLILMKPDKKLASLSGLVDQSSSLLGAYLAVNNSVEPGLGIVGDTIQFHGSADIYNVSGASVIATLYSNALTPTSNPAVTLRAVGSNGGQIAVFTYDLARSIIYTRQGNPAWSGQNRDTSAIIRSNDLFYGAASFDPQPDWLDINKVAIPQADEQQRLLANLILYMNFDKNPLPKFWYFPRGEKAVIIMTGDSEGMVGTVERFNLYLANSPAGCSVENWECVRSSSFLFPSPIIMTDQQALNYTLQGFEIGLHTCMGSVGTCNNWTSLPQLNSFYSAQLPQLSSAYPSIPSPSAERTHCGAWSDYSSRPKVVANYGIRLDTNYYYWSSQWNAAGRPGLFTGSGMPMRFADVDGTMIDVYQGATQMTDESGQSYPFTVDTLLNRALGSEGYYGAFVANLHTSSIPTSLDQIVRSALSHHVPVVSGRQMASWLDGRNNSYFSSITWNNGILNFSIVKDAGANGLRAMLPINGGSGYLLSLTTSGTSVPYTIQVIKGIKYAFFEGNNGNYQAAYGIDTTAPLLSGIKQINIKSDSATTFWITNELATSRVEYGTSSGSYPYFKENNDLVRSHNVILTGLASNTIYFYRVISRDDYGNISTSQEYSFTTGVPGEEQTILTNQIPDMTGLAYGGELGLRFYSNIDGYITAIRFWKSAGETGVHTGKIWDSNRNVIATVQFVNETASGWQRQNLSTPLPVGANTEYMVTVNAGGRYVDTYDAFVSEVVNGNVHAVAGTNGRYGNINTYPTSSYKSSNYFRDVIFRSR
jgi:hypothetical protein